YGVSNVIHSIDQFQGSYNFTLLLQDNYTFRGEFYDISGTISTFLIDTPVTIDYFGPDIYARFNTHDHSINPELSSISFNITDFTGIDKYWFNTSITGYWEVSDNLYTFFFNDPIISEGFKNIKLISNDTQGYNSELIFRLNLDKTLPGFSEISTNGIIISDILEINATVTEDSDYDLSFVFKHNSSGSIISNIDYTMLMITQDKWSITLDSSQIPDGYYDIILTAIDFAGNSNSTTIEDIYFDNAFPVVTGYEENIFVDSENIYNNTIYDELYFNDQEYILISAFDQAFDGFDWSPINPTIATQQGIKNITMYYTNTLAWYNLSISGTLDYDQFIYEIIGYNGNSDVQDIKGIQQIRIGDYWVEEFEIILDGTSILLKIDEKYRYLLSSQNSDKIKAQLYKSFESYNVLLEYNLSNNKWELKSPGLNYFNISQYLNLTEGNEFLFWFKIEDGVGNLLYSHDIKGIYDNLITQVPFDSNVFEWSLGTDSVGLGIIVFGSDDYLDSTIQVNISSVLPTSMGEVDVERIMIYGSNDTNTWEYIGRAYYSGEESLWNYFWDGDMLGAKDQLPPENYFLRSYVFDKAGNYLDWSGHYSGTFSFENETDGTSGIDIRFVDAVANQGSSYIKVISDLDGHDKVLEAYDGSNAGRNQINHNFNAQTSGSIEWWWRTTTTLGGSSLIFIGDGAGPYLTMGEGNFKYYNGITSIPLQVYSVNKWYHIRVDFETGISGYEGLSADRWHVYIDGVHYGDFVFRDSTDLTYVDTIVFYNGYWASSGYYIYYDGFGESWDPTYTIGQNKYEFVTSPVKTYDYTQIQLLTDLVFGDVLKYNSTAFQNEQDIKGTITNFFDSVNMWDVVSQYYNPLEKVWIPMATDSATILSNGSYSITWDIDKDSAFKASMYDFSYGYLPMQAVAIQNSDLWGSWAMFDSSGEWKPIIISDTGSNLDISIYRFNESLGWELDSSLSIESEISSISNQVFKLWDLNKDNIYEIIRISSAQIDVIYLDSNSNWAIKENVTGLSGYTYITFDIEYDGNSANTVFVAVQEDSLGVISLWKYSFDTDYSLTYLGDETTPTNFIPTSVRIVNYFSASDRKAILVGGLIKDSYYSQLFEYNINLELKNILHDGLLGEILVIEYDEINGADSIILGIERLAIGKMDAVIS
ncbi:hypothetical protein LCGC14_1568200, partial [marine sediment metagenome]